MYRSFQISVIVLWVFSMGWLLKSLLVPDNAGMVELDPRRPIHAFFDWNDSARMSLLKDGAYLGSYTLTSRSADAKKDDLPGVSVTGNLNGKIERPLLGLFTRTLFEFKDIETFDLDNGNILVRLPSKDLNIKIALGSGYEIETATVTMAKQTLFSYNGTNEDKLKAAAISGMGKNSSLVQGMLSSAGDPTKWQWNLKAYRGMYRFDDKRFPVYLLKLSIDQLENEIRFYLSESGEPLMLESDFGIKAYSELLVPVESLPKY